MHSIFTALLCTLTLASWSHSETSQLWGKSGEKWSPKGSLPDFSRAGYREGASLPQNFDNLKQVSVTDFGAIPNDGKDDTEAFRKALETKGELVVMVPEGIFEISDRIYIKSPKTVLRGASKEKSILLFPKGLEDIDPKPTNNSGGTPTTSYSWSGGFIEIRGSSKSKKLPAIAAASQRGSKQVTLTATPDAKPGDRIQIDQFAGEDLSLVKHLYAGDPSSISNMKARDSFSIIARVEKVQGNTLHLDRRLLFDVKPEWKATVSLLNPSVQYSGIENLSITFPAHSYGGHFRERGYNGINVGEVNDCWIKDVNIINADSGIFCRGSHCTLTGITISSPQVQGTKAGNAYTGETTGHHGIEVSGDSNLIQDFHFKTKFIHDLTIVRCSGNVFMSGSGLDLAIDHHKKAPFANLFTDINLGKGSRFLFSGGGEHIGRHSGAWGTFWNIHAEQPVYINPEFGPAEMNFVGVKASNEKQLKDKGFHVSSTPVAPLNLYEAQRERWLSN